MVELSGAELARAEFSGSKFQKCTIGFTIPGDVDLSEVERLDYVIHRAPSTIGINTIYKSKGKNTERFLRGAGIPDNFIRYISS